MNFRKVIVGTDFSEQSTNAIKTAADLVKKTGGTIDILHVCDNFHNYQLPARAEVSLKEGVTFEDYLSVCIQEKFDAQLKECSLDGIQVKTEIKFGSSKKTFINYVNEYDYDLVVLGFQGHDMFEEFLIGGFTSKLIKASEVPLLIVKNNNGTLPTQTFVSLALDKTDEKIYNATNYCQKTLGMKPFFVHVVDADPAIYFEDKSYNIFAKFDSFNELLEHEQELATKKLQTAIKEHGLDGELKVEITNSFDTATHLLDMNELNDSLIVVGRHKKNILAKWLFGSVSKKLVSLAENSVLIVK